LGFLPTTSHTRDDETRHIDGSVHDFSIFLRHKQQVIVSLNTCEFTDDKIGHKKDNITSQHSDVLAMCC